MSRFTEKVTEKREPTCNLVVHQVTIIDSKTFRKFLHSEITPKNNLKRSSTLWILYMVEDFVKLDRCHLHRSRKFSLGQYCVAIVDLGPLTMCETLVSIRLKSTVAIVVISLIVADNSAINSIKKLFVQREFDC